MNAAMGVLAALLLGACVALAGMAVALGRANERYRQVNAAARELLAVDQVWKQERDELREEFAQLRREVR